MAEPKPFTFDVRFDEEAEEKAARKKTTAAMAEKDLPPEETPPAEEEADSDPVAEPEPPPAFSQEDLDQACEEARALGHAAGKKEAHNEIKGIMAQAEEKIAHGFPDLQARHEAALEEIKAAALQMAAAVFQRAFPGLDEKHGQAEIEALMEETLPLLTTEPWVRVSLSPEMHRETAQDLEKTVDASGFQGKLEIIEDEAFEGSSCKIEWQNGETVRDVSTLVEKACRIVDKNVSAARENAPAEEAKSPTAKTQQEEPAGEGNG